MSKSGFSFSVEGRQISYSQKGLNFKNQRGKIADQN